MSSWAPAGMEGGNLRSTLTMHRCVLFWEALLKGGVSHQQLVAEHSDAPQIHLLVVHAPLNHLWGHVVQSATHRLPPQGGGVHRPAEVGNLRLSLEPQEQILWLYISVNHLLPVAVYQSICQLLHDRGCSLLVKSAAFLQVLIELPLGGHTPESSRSFAGHRSSCRDARCWDAADGPGFQSPCAAGAPHPSSLSET